MLLHIGNSQNELVKEVIQKHKDTILIRRLQLIFNELFIVYDEHGDLLKLSLSETIRSALKEESTNIVMIKEALTGIIYESMKNGFFQSESISTHLLQGQL